MRVPYIGTRIHELLNKNPSARCGLLPCELLVRKAPEAPPKVQGIAIALGYTPELKIPYILVTRHRKLKLELNWKAPFWLASYYWKVLCRLHGEKSHQQSYSTVNLTNCNSDLPGMILPSGAVLT